MTCVGLQKLGEEFCYSNSPHLQLQLQTFRPTNLPRQISTKLKEGAPPITHLLLASLLPSAPSIASTSISTVETKSEDTGERRSGSEEGEAWEISLLGSFPFSSS
ncbi:hypothetical protein SLEP1_g8806 [Rubroshorea leprosula]|uniref:Uncharacterized protein n=1 Tax=Rubroshorea leprosula TaxID=152421 RepID=A0AAV5ICQ6_9ROSI|nr:hypothetical protein SLEP1_g8806 [Rubroshorea leprosula]